ncbi:MAG: hypothetical protein H6993_07160 [Pseudomonadales bacterium]|nr:hypothetical protein [Pseudomonadales bacterium]MCP5183724.1 hypothetical protein [Pseudomonadales bacterium]
MRFLVGATVALLTLTLVVHPLLGGGVLWDLGNAIGLLALAGVLTLFAPGQFPRTPRRHQQLANAVLLMLLAHALWFPLTDAASHVYLLPGAPTYMWLGVAGFVVLLVAWQLSLPGSRQRWHASPASFRRWHRRLGMLAIILAAGHITLSGFYLGSPWQAAVFMVLVIAAPLLARSITPRLTDSGAPTVTQTVSVWLLACVAFVALRNLA